MKRLIIVSAILFVTAGAAYAETGMMSGGMMGGQKGGKEQQGMMMQEGMMKDMMPMMQMCMPMMKQMMGQGMMMQDMMHMMKDMMKMQKKMMMGMSRSEKKEMTMEMGKMMEQMDSMMSDMRGMTMQGMMGGASSTATPSKEGQKGNTAGKTREAAEAGVTVKVTLEDRNEILKFKVALDTHTAELDKYKFAEIVVLRADGKEYRGSVKSEEGSGHHRSALIEFENPKTKEVSVVVKDVAGVKERAFNF
ncbi:MAG: hypothetical protein M0Z67_03020 [Nitrospiraceae bacterium]|nr:hypothetical protein [Nitrospiraceae bacterium]